MTIIRSRIEKEAAESYSPDYPANLLRKHERDIQGMDRTEGETFIFGFFCALAAQGIITTHVMSYAPTRFEVAYSMSDYPGNFFYVSIDR